MGTRPADRPAVWEDLDRDSLTELLSSGLTPAQVGHRFGRNRDAVRSLVDRWHLDSRALRARALGLAAKHPDIADEFVAVVAGAPLDHRPQDLSVRSSARCRWRCRACGHEWVASVGNRTGNDSGCPPCARLRVIAAARARPARTRPLAEVDPGLVPEFVDNLSRPDRGVHDTPSGSHDRIQWQCRRGHRWQTEARQRVTHRTQCPTCRAGSWTSRLEHQVAELVHLLTGWTVVVGDRRPRADRRGDENVDLLVREPDVRVDLDPSAWHADAAGARRDRRKLERLAGERYVRVRPATLGRLVVPGASAHQQVLMVDADESEPWSWAIAVVQALQGYWPSLVPGSPSPAERAAALARGDLRWRQLRAEPRAVSLLSEHPDLAREFVEVVDRPHLTAADLAPGCDERVRWRCADCGHEWAARVANRSVLQTGCPPCSYRRGAAKSAAPEAGRSFADLHPELVRFFRSDETNPGRALSDLRPNSTDQCLWNCPHCGLPWRARPQTLHRRPDAGCLACSSLRSALTRRHLRSTEAKTATPLPGPVRR